MLTRVWRSETKKKTPVIAATNSCPIWIMESRAADYSAPAEKRLAYAAQQYRLATCHQQPRRHYRRTAVNRFETMAFIESALIAILFVVSFALSFLIAIPLAGALVRFRANYTPKGLQLDGEGGVQPHTGPVVTSYLAMIKRVKRLEV